MGKSKKSFRKVSVGDTLSVRYNGSSLLGNSSFVLDDVVVTAVSTDRIETTIGDIYYSQSRWRYGTSAEVATLLDVFK